MYKLGIDVGGTNTDAVLVDENRAVVADIKYPTSADIYDGILGAMRTVLKLSGVDPKQIRQAMLGTTQCTNAIVERKNLAPIGILRIGAPATTGIRPMVDWAEDIQRIAVGSAIIGVILLLFVNRKSHVNPYILVLQCADSATEATAKAYLETKTQRCVLKSKAVQAGNIELNLELRLKSDNTDFINELSAMDGVTSAALVSYNGDYMG